MSCSASLAVRSFLHTIQSSIQRFATYLFVTNKEQAMPRPGMPKQLAVLVSVLQHRAQEQQTLLHQLQMLRWTLSQSLQLPVRSLLAPLAQMHSKKLISVESQCRSQSTTSLSPMQKILLVQSLRHFISQRQVDLAQFL